MEIKALLRPMASCCRPLAETAGEFSGTEPRQRQKEGLTADP